jgi:fermentation-respiration switch protein FrsA (DUF1100 family)
MKKIILSVMCLLAFNYGIAMESAPVDVVTQESEEQAPPTESLRERLLLRAAQYIPALRQNPPKTFKSEQSTFIFSHGFGSVGAKAQRYAIDGILPENTVSFDYQDAETKVLASPLQHGVALGTRQSCIGQQANVDRLLKVIEEQEKPVVLFGESRGASTILNAASVMPNNVQAIVVDSSFDCLENVIRHRMHRFGAQRVVDPKRVAGSVSKLLPNYDPKELQPITSLDQANEQFLHTPLLLLCSQEDTQVPYTGSAAMYKLLRQRNHPLVHLLMFEKGGHGWLMEGPEGEKYRNGVHAFFARYGVEHIEEYAQQGKEILDTTQPDVE